MIVFCVVRASVSELLPNCSLPAKVYTPGHGGEQCKEQTEKANALCHCSAADSGVFLVRVLVAP